MQSQAVRSPREPTSHNGVVVRQVMTLFKFRSRVLVGPTGHVPVSLPRVFALDGLTDAFGQIRYTPVSATATSGR